MGYCSTYSRELPGVSFETLERTYQDSGSTTATAKRMQSGIKNGQVYLDCTKNSTIV